MRCARRSQPYASSDIVVVSATFRVIRLVCFYLEWQLLHFIHLFNVDLSWLPHDNTLINGGMLSSRLFPVHYIFPHRTYIHSLYCIILYVHDTLQENQGHRSSKSPHGFNFMCVCVGHVGLFTSSVIPFHLTWSTDA
jgi:hypothetical protein